MPLPLHACLSQGHIARLRLTEPVHHYADWLPMSLASALPGLALHRTTPGHGYSSSLLADRLQDRYNYRAPCSTDPVQCRCTHEVRLRSTHALHIGFLLTPAYVAYGRNKESLMPFTVEEFRDLVRILEERPEWRNELRRLILTDQLLALPEQLAELRVHTEQRFQALAAQMADLIQIVQTFATDLGTLKGRSLEWEYHTKVYAY